MSGGLGEAKRVIESLLKVVVTGEETLDTVGEATLTSSHSRFVHSLSRIEEMIGPWAPSNRPRIQ
ncbi:hypothetical protein GCM10010182_10700 [Actinomadura cremea]|nr:hypothetical protein GCM10010182_10700 [Actinomadura cremea]